MIYPGGSRRGFTLLEMMVVMAVIAVTDEGFVLEEVAPGFTPDDIVERTAARLSVPGSVGTITS